MDSGFYFPFASALKGDFFFALETDFGFDFAFRVGLGTDGVANILSSSYLDIFL